MRYNKVIFYNTFHNGDVHLSREFVKKMMDKLPNVEFFYAHKNNPNLLNDIPRLKWIPFPPLLNDKNYTTSFSDGNTLYCNTWYGSSQRLFNTYGVTFDCLYYIFADHLKCFNINIKDLFVEFKELYPKIDFSHFYIGNANNYLENVIGKKVYISNGEPLSGQATLFSLAPMINTLAQANKDILFILSNPQKDLANHPNVILAQDIIKKPTSGDLNENAFITTKCNIIVGKSSGTYTFAMIQDNMFNKNKTMISFSTIGSENNDYWLGPDTIHSIKYDAKIMNYNFSTAKECTAVVQHHINGLSNE